MLSGKLQGKPDAEATLQNLSSRFPKALYEQRKAGLDCQIMLYEVGGIHVTGFVIKPKAVAGKLPVVIYNRGGNAGFGALMFSGEIWERLMPLAENGFVVLASQYRSGQPLMPQWKTANDEFGGADVEDVLALLELATQIPQADLNRIGVAGHSRGGMMSYLVAQREPRVKAIATLAGSVDLLHDLQQRPEMENVYRERIPNYLNDKDAVLRARSAIYWVEQLRPELPILIIHGEQDERVPFANATRMAEKLAALHRPYRLLAYPNSHHSLTEDAATVNKELANWFQQHLGTEPVSALVTP